MDAGSRIWIFASTSVFFISKGEEIIAILALDTDFGMRGWTFSLSIARPFMSSVSLIDPPVFVSTLMLSIFTRESFALLSTKDFKELTKKYAR